MAERSTLSELDAFLWARHWAGSAMIHRGFIEDSERIHRGFGEDSEKIRSWAHLCAHGNDERRIASNMAESVSGYTTLRLDSSGKP
jgi:hypothetical protein